MDCRTARDRIASWLEGELARGEAELIEDHLDHCEACRELAERLSQQEEMLGLLKPPELDALGEPGFWDRMDTAMAVEVERKRVEEAKKRRLWRRVAGWRLQVPGPVALAYAVLLGLVLAWGWGQRVESLSARQQIEDLGIALEREQRLSAPPAPAVRAGSWRSAMYTPVRGNL